MSAALKTPEQLGLPRRATLAEYFQIDAASQFKCEFHAGTVVCMPGGTEFHALITGNVGTAIGIRLRGTPCRMYSPDLRIAVPCKTYLMYPDVPVVCGPSEYDPRDPDRRTIVNPRLIVEVLSPTTEGFDRGEKFERYMQLPAFQEYVLVTQDRPRVESLLRQGDGTWSFTHAVGIDATLRLRSLDIDLPLAEVYANVTFAPPADDGSGEAVLVNC
jgi:Uma2 family endonuclease